MGATHLMLLISSTGQMLKRLPLVINLHQTKSLVHERLQVFLQDSPSESSKFLTTAYWEVG